MCSYYVTFIIRYISFYLIPENSEREFTFSKRPLKQIIIPSRRVCMIHIYIFIMYIILYMYIIYHNILYTHTYTFVTLLYVASVRREGDIIRDGGADKRCSDNFCFRIFKITKMSKKRETERGRENS